MNELKEFAEKADSLKDFLKRIDVDEDNHVVLASLYYLEVTENRKCISAEHVNNELKDGGLALKNIHRLMYDLTDGNPPYLEEVKQAGEFPPDTVHYDLTEEGRLMLQEMIREKRDSK